MPAVPPTPRVKLRTATRRVPRTRNADADAAALPDLEPNMRLSRAILVMLLLHVVAVGGILAFSLVKERGHGRAPAGANGAVEAEDTDVPPAQVEGRDVERSTPAPDGTLTRVTNDPNSAAGSSTAASDAAERIAGGHANSLTANAVADKGGRLPADSGKTYQVHKGDSVYTIAEKLKVEASALLKLNGIDDPKKLQPGQMLHVPAAAHAKTK